MAKLTTMPDKATDLAYQFKRAANTKRTTKTQYISDENESKY